MTAAPKSVRGTHLKLVAPPVEPDLATQRGLEQVERIMRELCGLSPSARAKAMTHAHLASGGKRLRARLALAATECMGGSIDDGAVWAAAVELLHNATLVHDDIQDQDFVRRGKPTLWAMHGTAQAMNAGDLMLMLPYLALGRLRSPVSGELCRAIAEHAVATVCGQIDEHALLGDRALGWDSYLDAVAGKTGALLSLPVYGATLLCGRSMGQAHELASAFGPLGVMFQLQDDVLDLYGDKGRHDVGCDLYEGKVSALVVAHLELVPGDREWLVDLLATPREQTRRSDVLDAIGRFVRSGALDLVLDKIEALAAETARSSALKKVPAMRAVAVRLADLATRPIQHCRSLATGETA